MEPQEPVDWTAVRSAAQSCLKATWSLVCFAERSLDDDYDVDQADCHLATIDRALGTFKESAFILCQDRLDSLALASVGEGPRPEFAYRHIVGASAHEVSRKLLQQALLFMESCLFDLEVGSLRELGTLSREELRTTLPLFEQMNSLQHVLYVGETQEIRAWIDREWAAVSRLAGAERNDDAGSRKQKPRSKPGRKISSAKILLGQALQFDWLTYTNEVGPDDENDVYDDWRIEHGLTGEFGLSLEKAKTFRRWFTDYTRQNRNPEHALELKGGFKLSEGDERAIIDWLDSLF